MISQVIFNKRKIGDICGDLYLHNYINKETCRILDNYRMDGDWALYAKTLKQLGFRLKATRPAIELEDSRFEVSCINKEPIASSPVPNLPQFQIVNHAYTLELNAVLSKAVRHQILSKHDTAMIHRRSMCGEWLVYYSMLEAIPGLTLTTNTDEPLNGNTMVNMHLRITEETKSPTVFTQRNGCNSIW